MQIEKNTDSQARERLSLLFDDGIYNEINSKVKEKDDLTGVVSAYGYVNGNAVYAFSQDKSVNGGAVGEAQAAKIAKLYELAAKTGTPIVGIHDSDGAFVDGTAASLAAYGKMLSASAVVSGVVPQISVIAGTCAGTAAMLACSSDFVIVTKESEFFAAPNSSKGSAQAAAESGIAAVVCDDDKAAVEKARELINILPVNNLAPVPMFEFADAAPASSGDFKGIVSSVADADSEIELYADFGTEAYTGFVTVGGAATGIAAAGKNSGKLTSDDCMKLARFVRTCDAFSIPVVTFVDSEGFADADAVAAVKAMTTLANSYAEATTVKIAVVTGKAVGPVFAAVAGSSANSDFTYSYPDAVIAPLAPVTAVEFMWHDKLQGAENLEASRNKLAAEYEKTLASAQTAAENNFIDDIIEPSQTRSVLISALDILSGKRVQKLPKKHNNIPF
ncbi:carboxyl transferase domain-containing protein [Porcipelethomonas sp.]|uniref:carboxyl transferase domain-containing protein n=1 Tax=Porcipelethomonas sp. TaxID=2981675 RepID=UPI003EF3A5AE